MIFGPFNSSAMKSLTLALEKLQVPYQFTKDDELLAELERSGKKGNANDPTIMILEIEDAVFADKKVELLQLGLGGDHEEPEFVEEYVCPDCGKVVAEAPGICPKHTTALITWSEHVEKKRLNQSTGSSIGTNWLWAVLGAAALGYGVYYMIAP
jgi:hypothetical protein